VIFVHPQITNSVKFGTLFNVDKFLILLHLFKTNLSILLIKERLSIKLQQFSIKILTSFIVEILCNPVQQFIDNLLILFIFIIFLI